MDHIYVLRERLDDVCPSVSEDLYFSSKQGAHDYLIKEGYKIKDKTHEVFRTTKKIKSKLDQSYVFTESYTAFLSKEKVLP